LFSREKRKLWNHLSALGQTAIEGIGGLRLLIVLKKSLGLPLRIDGRIEKRRQAALLRLEFKERGKERQGHRLSILQAKRGEEYLRQCKKASDFRDYGREKEETQAEDLSTKKSDSPR